MIALGWVITWAVLWLVFSTVASYLLSFILDRWLLRVGWVTIATLGCIFFGGSGLIDSAFSKAIFGRNIEIIAAFHMLLLILVSINFEKIQRVVGYPRQL